MTSIAPLFPQLRPIADGSCRQRQVVAEGTLFLAPDTVATIDLVRFAIGELFGDARPHWCFAHDRTGAPIICSDIDLPPAVSVAATRRTRALLLGPGPLGIDVETIDRVAVNATINDDWLATTERSLLASLPRDKRALELACRWVLREAYGKASGRGLDLPLARLGFTVESGVVTLPTSSAAGGGWTFSLHRSGSLVIGIVAAGLDR